MFAPRSPLRPLRTVLVVGVVAAITVWRVAGPRFGPGYSPSHFSWLAFVVIGTTVTVAAIVALFGIHRSS